MDSPSDTIHNGREARVRNHETENTHKDYLNFGEVDQMEISGYKFCKMRATITWILYMATLGLLRLIHHWYPRWHLQSTHTRCSLENAAKVLIMDTYKNKYKTYFVKEVKKITSSNANDLIKTDFDNNDVIGEDKEILQHLIVRFADGIQKLQHISLIRCKKLCYAWNPLQGRFMKIQGLDVGATRRELHEYKGYSSKKQLQKRITYGQNEIIVPVAGILKLLAVEILTPFYTFQLFSIIVWLCENYYYYCIAIVIMSVSGISSSVIQTRRNQKNLRGTVHSKDLIRVCRGNGIFETVSTASLVPGDIIQVPLSGCIMHCDAVLLKGSCIVNESMLTGESVPVTKTHMPINDDMYNVKEDNSHTLFCGTKVIQTRNYGDSKVTAVVIRTGYLTAKGQLVRSILYPPPADFKFDQDSYKFIGILAFIATLCFIYTIVSKSARGITPLDILIKALDVITIAIPPALPAAMTVGKLYALTRLKNHKIFCMNSRVINVSGSINCVCFDKTGTLTEDGMDMWGVVPVEDGEVKEEVRDVTCLPNNSNLMKGMACCHSLALIDGELLGDPLDVKMFESTGWVLEEPDHADHTEFNHFVKPNQVTKVDHNFLLVQEQQPIALIKQFQFASNLQRMSVITKQKDSSILEAYCKGSPERIISLCLPDSVPENILERLKEFTVNGYRVIAMAKRVLNEQEITDIEHVNRKIVEHDLTFLGLLIMENRLKPETSSVIEILNKAEIKVLMITGDNIQTALSVAQECGIVTNRQKILEIQAVHVEKGVIRFDRRESVCRRISSVNCKDVELGSYDYKYAMEGSTWAAIKKHSSVLMPEVISKGAVFARMSGKMKQELIEELQNSGYYVAMCGDGANDCGALKAAHVGVSLSEAEASVASPFTSQDPNISCIPLVIREGRAALVTSFGVMKYMICYSLTELTSVMILYMIDSNLTSMEFLFIDIVLVLNFASVFGNTNAYTGKLAKKPPLDSLLSFVPIASIVWYMIITIGFQVGIFFLVQTFSWFVPFQFDPDRTTSYSCYENYAVYCLSMYQYVTSAISFSKGRPYRKPIYTNKIFTLSLIITTLLCVYITVYPAVWLQDLLELELPPYYDIRIVILLLALANLLTCLIAEEVVVEYLLHKFLWPKMQKCKNYLKISKSSWRKDCDSAVIVVKDDGGLDNPAFDGCLMTKV